MRSFSQLEAQAAPILTPREEHRIPTKWTSYFLSAALELDVRVSPHPARAFTNAPCGARSLLSVILARGSVDDSWHASTPSCQPCQNRLDCARYDGGSGSLPLGISEECRKNGKKARNASAV